MRSVRLIYLFCFHWRLQQTCWKNDRENSYIHIYIYFISCDCMLKSSYAEMLKNCWVRLLSNYNIKNICTIYTRLDTCLMSISRFSLRDNVTLRLLKLYFYIADMVEWSRVLNIRLSDWCCSVSMVWVKIPSREEQNFVSSKI